MNWTAVESSQITEVGYNEDSEILGIRFPAGKRSPASEYHYANVPARVHRALIAAESVGSYLAKEIKSHPDKYPYTRIGEPLPPEPEEPTGSALAKIDKLTPEEIFIPGTLDPILAAIKDEVDRQALGLKGLTVKANRDALRSLAMRVVKSRTFVEGQRKGLVAARKKALADIDSEARRIGAILKGIEDHVRAPLTAWEKIDKDRKARHEGNLEFLLQSAKVPFGSHSGDILNMIADVEGIDVGEMEEFGDLAAGHQESTLTTLRSALKVAQAQEAQQAEIARLQAEANERAIKERERLAAEAAIQQEKVESARREREALQRAELAEKMRIAAEQDAARKAEAAAAQAERDKEAAIEAERKRAEYQKALEQAEAVVRENNQKYKAAIHAEIRNSMLGFLVERSANEGVDFVIEAISAGHIPHVSISY